METAIIELGLFFKGCESTCWEREHQENGIVKLGVNLTEIYTYVKLSKNEFKILLNLKRSFSKRSISNVSLNFFPLQWLFILETHLISKLKNSKVPLGLASHSRYHLLHLPSGPKQNHCLKVMVQWLVHNRCTNIYLINILN